MPDYRRAVDDDVSGARVRLHVSPRARETRLEGLHDDAVRLRVAAPPVEGRANEQVVRYLARILGVRPRDVVIVAGRRSRTKIVVVRGLDASTVVARLQAGGA